MGRHSKDPTTKCARRIKRRREVAKTLGPMVDFASVTDVGETPCGRRKYVEIAAPDLPQHDRSISNDPAYGVARAISHALDPVRAPSKGRSLANMTDEERRQLEQAYGASVKPPKLRRVRLQREAKLSVEVLEREYDKKHLWWLRRNMGMHSKSRRREKFISLVKAGRRCSGTEPLDIELELFDGRYCLGCGSKDGGYREEFVVDDRYPEVEEEP